MNNYCSEILCLNLVAPIFKSDITEAVEVVIGLMNMLLAVADKYSLRLCRIYAILTNINIYVIFLHKVVDIIIFM